MGTFVLTFFMVCISTALSLKLQSENAGTYVRFVIIYKSACKLFIYWVIFKIRHIDKKQGYDMGVTILIFHDI